ncbi:Sorting Nexin-14 [Manis pentadactyla]|nr:Sorting Nexin-14 [Manis pentadactyla]
MPRTTFPRAAAARKRPHFRLFARFGGLALGEGASVEELGPAPAGRANPKSGLDPGRQILDPEQHLLSRAQRKEWLLHIQKQIPRLCSSLR